MGIDADLSLTGGQVYLSCYLRCFTSNVDELLNLLQVHLICIDLHAFFPDAPGIFIYEALEHGVHNRVTRFLVGLVLEDKNTI